jgi:hypothetical protein
VNEIHALPPPIDIGRSGYVRKEKRFARPSTTRDKGPKKKVKKKIPYQILKTSKLN